MGALQVGTLDVRFAADDARAAVGEALRTLVSGLDEGTNLHVLHRADDRIEPVVQEYEALAAGAVHPDLAAYVADRAAWLRRRRARRVSVFLFFSRGAGGLLGGATPGALGRRLQFKRRRGLTREQHRAELVRFSQLRDRLVGQLG